ncbi:MAG: hypothetical protein IKV03_04870 [Alphaproteobacteria bacterium]|nr:hypothetical protein [Alphaproteobacteria bacterium]
MRQESGRSMVEMLGTLAIIGVLSIGSIAGYSYGIDKHHANQTINDIMLMGIDAITQASQRKDPSLVEWGTKTSVGYTFSATTDPENDTKYGIKIEGVPSRICKMIGDALKSTVEVYVSDEGYNVSSNVKDPCDLSDKNTMEFYFDLTPPECKTDADCGEGNYCDTNMGWCFSGEKPMITATRPFCMHGENNQCCGNISGAPGYELKHGNDCTLSDGTSGMCYYGECIAKGCTYTKNKCRGEKEYCASPNTSCDEAFPEGKTGSCVKVDFTAHNINGKTYYVSKWPMSWWDGDAACRSIGRDGLISGYELLNNWDGSNSYQSSPVHYFTKNDLAEFLEEITFYSHDNVRIWLSENENTCKAYSLFLYSGSVSGYDKNDSDSWYGNYAVCK